MAGAYLEPNRDLSSFRSSALNPLIIMRGFLFTSLIDGCCMHTAGDCELSEMKLPTAVDRL